MILFSNNAVATLASGISSGATVLALTTGQGALFPSPSGSDYFYATLVNASNQLEIVRCTARTSDSLTVVRGQDNTTARAYLAGDQLSLRPVAAAFQEMQALADNTVTAAKIASNAVTSVKIQDGAVTTTKILDGNVTAAKLASGAVLGQIGFTPVKQTGGNTIRFEWDGTQLQSYIDDVSKGIVRPQIDNGTPFGGGYRGFPQTVITTSTALDFVHAQRMLVATAPGLTVVCPTFASKGFGDGTMCTVVNVSGGSIFIDAEAGATLQWSGNLGSGGRTLAHNSRANILRVTGNTWIVDGSGLS